MHLNPQNNEKTVRFEAVTVFLYKEDLRMKILTAALILLSAGILLCACTDYERAGVNPRPFNEPRNWEINPYGPNMFQN